MKKIVLAFVLVLMLAVLAACGSGNGGSAQNGSSSDTQTSAIQGGESAKSTYKSVSMAEGAKLIESEKDYILLDVRTPAEFAEGHIPGAINVPNESIGKEAPSELPNKDQLILVYCRSGNRSKQASDKLAKLGYSNIIEIGGINSWTGDIEK